MALDWTINKFSPSLGLERSDRTNCIMSNGNLKRISRNWQQEDKEDDNKIGQ